MKLVRRVACGSFWTILSLSCSSFGRAFTNTLQPRQHLGYSRIAFNQNSFGYSTTSPLSAKPKRGSVVESYQTVSVNCAKCGQRLFRYKKKNGTKSNLVKCFVERISEDSAGVLQAQQDSASPREEFSWTCPSCDTQFGRSATIKGLPAIKMVGGKIRMTKK